MKQRTVLSVFSLLLLALPATMMAGWFSNDHFVVEPFEFEMKCPPHVKVLEMEVVQQKSYALHMLYAALPYWKFIRVNEENVLQGFSQEGDTIKVSTRGNTMSLDDFDYVKKFDDEVYTAKDLSYYSSGHIDLVRADFDVKLNVQDVSGATYRLRIRCHGNFTSEKSLSKARSKKLTRRLKEALDGLEIASLDGPLGDKTLTNHKSNTDLPCSVQQRDFTMQPIDFKVVHNVKVEMLSAEVTQRATYGKVKEGQLEVTSVVSKDVPFKLKEEVDEYKPELRKWSVFKLRESTLELPTANPDTNAGGTLKRVDLSVAMVVKSKEGEIYRCTAQLLGRETGRKSIILMASKHCQPYLEKFARPVVLRLAAEDLRTSDLKRYNATHLIGMKCIYEKLEEGQRVVKNFKALHGVD